MRIDCYLSEHCGSYHQLRENIGCAVQELGLNVEVFFHTISCDEAARLGISGSPAIRLDGEDLFPGAASPGIA